MHDLTNLGTPLLITICYMKEVHKRLRPHHFWTDTSNLTTVVISVLKFMINGTTSILKS